MVSTRRPRRSAALVALVLAAAAAWGCSPREEIAEIQVEGYGAIRFRFLADAAPRHVERFKRLARTASYDGTTFGRVAPGFMIQGGDPGSRSVEPAGTAGAGPEPAPAEPLPAEASDLRHREGSVSMAHGDARPSARAEFFIVLRDHDDWKTQLDGRYTVFGQVIDGMDVARKIAWVPRDDQNRPLQPVVITSVRLVKARLPR